MHQLMSMKILIAVLVFFVGCGDAPDQGPESEQRVMTQALGTTISAEIEGPIFYSENITRSERGRELESIEYRDDRLDLLTQDELEIAFNTRSPGPGDRTYMHRYSRQGVEDGEVAETKVSFTIGPLSSKPIPVDELARLRVARRSAEDTRPEDGRRRVAFKVLLGEDKGLLNGSAATNLSTYEEGALVNLALCGERPALRLPQERFKNAIMLNLDRASALVASREALDGRRRSILAAVARFVPAVESLEGEVGRTWNRDACVSVSIPRDNVRTLIARTRPHRHYLWPAPGVIDEGLETDGVAGSYGMQLYQYRVDRNVGEMPSTRTGGYTDLTAAIIDTNFIDDHDAFRDWANESSFQRIKKRVRCVKGQSPPCQIVETLPWIAPAQGLPDHHGTFIAGILAGELMEGQDPNFIAGVSYDEGKVTCWGRNTNGQGDVPLGLEAQDVAAGYAHTCALTKQNDVVCWGANNYGQSTVPALGVVTQLDGKHTHSCAVHSGGQLTCWGHNGFGQTDVPSGIGAVTRVTTGHYQTCALNTQEQVYCWGYSGYGATTVPGGLGPVIDVATGRAHTCAASSAGTVTCWGNNTYGQTTVPGGIGGVVQIAAGHDHTCARTLAGSVMCWGRDRYGEATVPGELGIVRDIAASYSVSCAINEYGRTTCWGLSLYGGISPSDLGPKSRVAVGGKHVCTANEDGVDGAVLQLQHSGYAPEAGMVLVQVEGIGILPEKAAAFDFVSDGSLGGEVDVISHSMGSGNDDYCQGDESTNVVVKAANDAFKDGILVVKAAGNVTPTTNCTVTSPGDAAGVLTVGALEGYSAWHEDYRTSIIRDSSSFGMGDIGRLEPRTVVDIAAAGCRDFAPMADENGNPRDANGDPIYGYGCGTSYATPAVAAAAINFKDNWIEENQNNGLKALMDNASYLKTNMLLMGDRYNGTGYLEVGFDPLYGAGRLKMRKFDGLGMDYPWDHDTGTFQVHDGADITYWIKDNGWALSNDVDALKFVAWWYEPNTDFEPIPCNPYCTDVGGTCSGNECTCQNDAECGQGYKCRARHNDTIKYCALPAADIVLEIRAFTDNCNTSIPTNKVGYWSDYSYDTKKHITIPTGAGGKCFKVNVRGLDVTGDDAGQPRRDVYFAYYWEDTDRNDDSDGFPTLHDPIQPGDIERP